MPRRAGTYRLTPELVAAHGGGPVVCLDIGALGRTFRLHATRPDASTIRRLTSADMPGMGGGLGAAVAVDPLSSVMRVDIRGPLEQRAGYHDLCSGWTDGYDALAERMQFALEAGDVLLVIDTPGGACAGLAECVRTIQQAKAFHGRRVTAYIDEACGSAGYWIAATVADEIFGPASMSIGSIGARSAWCGIAGALAKEGVEVVHFAFPPGKVALASEQALPDVAWERAMRDIMLAFESFAAAVGPPRGLSRDAIVALDGDCLTGAAAVAAGLADGVASLDEVVTHALAMASGEETTMPDDEMPAEETTTAAEDEETEPEMADGEEGEDEEGEEPIEPDAKAKAPAAATARKPAGSLVALAGLPVGASDLAIRNSLRDRVGVYQHAAKLTGATNPGEITGHLDAIAHDAAACASMRVERDEAKRKANAAERLELLRKLAAANVHTRGELFADVIDEKTGKRAGVRPATLWGPGPSGRSLQNLRGYTAQALAKVAPDASRRTPFEPDATSAEQAAGKRASGEPSASAIEAAKKNPAVIKAASRPGAKPIDEIARAHVAAFGGAS